MNYIETETKEEVLEFLTNKEKRVIEIITKKNTKGDKPYTKTIFKKAYNVFDLLYISEYSQSEPDFGDKLAFAGVVDTRTNQFYFLHYSLRSMLGTYEEVYQEAGLCKTREEVEENINKAIEQEYIKLAEMVPDDLTATSHDIYCARRSAEVIYIQDKKPEIKYNSIKKNYYLSAILEFLEEPESTVKKIITEEQKAIEKAGNKPNYTIRSQKLRNRLEAEILKEIETSPTYKRLRQFKEIMQAIPQGAKQITFTYLLSNGEILKGKLDTRGLNNAQPREAEEDAEIYGYYIDRPSRTRLEEVDGYKNNDLKLKNIMSLSYKGKEIYTNPEHTKQ